MTIEEYHMIVIERLLTLYRELPLDHCGYVITAIEDIETVYYGESSVDNSVYPVNK
jgi:hypothetical protein